MQSFAVVAHDAARHQPVNRKTRGQDNNEKRAAEQQRQSHAEADCFHLRIENGLVLRFLILRQRIVNGEQRFWVLATIDDVQGLAI